MQKEIRQIAIKQYLRYFKIWFIILGVCFLLWALVAVSRLGQDIPSRDNGSAPSERVYDYAEVLSPKEEAALRNLIAETEEEIRCDIVLVTIEEPVGTGDYQWNYNMRNLADDFYDQMGYGYDGVHGDGVLLLDNWYEGQKGTWISTCGRAVDEIGESDEYDILRAVSRYADEDPYRAYHSGIEEISASMDGDIPFPLLLIIIPAVIMLIFVAVKMRSAVGKDTVNASTYVAGGKPEFKEKSDHLVNKFITKRHIPKPSGGAGGGGSHRSSSGVRHGGGGMRR